MTTFIASALVLAKFNEPIHLTHQFKPGQIYDYELRFTQAESNTDMRIRFSVTIGKKEDGRTPAVVTLTKAMRGDSDAQMEMPNMPMNLSEYGVPIDGEYFEKAGLVIYTGLMTTYLPNKQLKKGETFKIQRKSEKFEFFGTGQLVGFGSGKDRGLARIKFDTFANPANFGNASLIAESLYDPMAKRFVRCVGEMTVAGNTMKMQLDLKNVRTR